jgi:hypothetical protein
MRDEARRRLGLQEVELIEALTANRHSPDGIDLDVVEAARRQLVAKRVRSVGKTWPALRRALGEEFESVALEVLAQVPMAPRHHAVVDGLAVAEHSRDRALGGDEIKLALLDHHAYWAQSAGAIRPRYGPWIGMTRLPGSGGFAVAARLKRRWIWVFRPRRSA